ncbi:MAG: hypothetical protein KF821_09455 [Anaerolineales bacterium]|nr:hypothetical protein [Anaerolineales bacterium]MBX3006034.1 hypothetical protein [Anaerolineales bacterium]MCW5838982.1 hypothetical protein [Anaerolineales bacterium]MCW5887888.1 hypothetical protein [Anaerolineales bacterium]
MNIELTTMFEAINALGVIGLLAFMVVAFYRGDLIARSLLDRILRLYEQQIGELSQRILAKLEEVMQDK